MPSPKAQRTPRGRATRERIVAAAAELIVARGVAATSLDQIRARASVSKSQLYHYFDDKDDLVRAVVSSTVDGVIAAVPAPRDLSSLNAIAAWFDALVMLQIERNGTGGCPIGGLASELADHDEEARALLADGYDRWERPLREGLQRLRDRGGLRADADPAGLATSTLAAIQGGLVLTQARHDPRQLRVALDAALAHLREHAPRP